MVDRGDHLDGQGRQPPGDRPGDRAAAAAVRTTGGQYAPGNSGNPAGRPAAAREVREAAACHTLAAVAVLAEVLHDPAASQSMRFRAAQSVLRAAGLQREDDADDELAARSAARAEDATQRAVRLRRLAEQEESRRTIRRSMGLPDDATLSLGMSVPRDQA